MVKSEKSALVLGKSVYHELYACWNTSKEERLEMTTKEKDEDDELIHQLDEMLDAARLKGMSEPGLEEAEKMLKGEFFEIWRLKLRPSDVADLPALRIELMGEKELILPKPYRRRYSPAEINNNNQSFYLRRINEIKY